ncbi:MAG: hypothetical protein ACN6RK_12355 [Stenotrophomonas sp.]
MTYAALPRFDQQQLEQQAKKDPHLAMRVFNQILAPEVGLEPTTP